VSDVPLGLISLCLLAPLILTEIWLAYMVHHYTEKAEPMLPKSVFVETNRAAFAQAGLLGKAMRNGVLTLVLMIPGLCARRGILDLKEAQEFPTDLKWILFLSWGMCFVLFSTLMVFGIYLRYTGRLGGV
jgi:hypothetical protein